MKATHYLVLAATIFILSACGVSPEERNATETAVVEGSATRKAAYFATQTAAPTSKPAYFATQTAAPTKPAYFATQTAAPTKPAPTSTPATFLMLDGYDKDAGLIVQVINLWQDYDDRSAGITAKANHGDRVKLIRRSGDGVLIELGNGKRGWVTYYFIKEYK